MTMAKSSMHWIFFKIIHGEFWSVWVISPWQFEAKTQFYVPYFDIKVQKLIYGGMLIPVDGFVYITIYRERVGKTFISKYYAKPCNIRLVNNILSKLLSQICNMEITDGAWMSILSGCWWNFLTSANQIVQIGSRDRSRIHVPDQGGTAVWPGKNGFHKKYKILDNIAVYLIAKVKVKKYTNKKYE